MADAVAVAAEQAREQANTGKLRPIGRDSCYRETWGFGQSKSRVWIELRSDVHAFHEARCQLLVYLLCGLGV